MTVSREAGMGNYKECEFLGWYGKEICLRNFLLIIIENHY